MRKTELKKLHPNTSFDKATEQYRNKSGHQDKEQDNHRTKRPIPKVKTQTGEAKYENSKCKITSQHATCIKFEQLQKEILNKVLSIVKAEESQSAVSNTRSKPTKSLLSLTKPDKIECR